MSTSYNWYMSTNLNVGETSSRSLGVFGVILQDFHDFWPTNVPYHNYF